MMDLVALPVTIACSVLQVYLYQPPALLVYFVSVPFLTANHLDSPPCVLLGIKRIRIGAIRVYPGKFQ